MDGNKSTTYTTLNIFKSSKQNDKDKACSYIIPNEKLKLEILQCNSIPNIQFAHNK